MLLANAWCPSREQEWNRFAQEFACYYRRPLPERGLRFIRSNLQFSSDDNVPGIDSFVDVMDGHTRRRFPIREHPIEGFGPTVPWQQGGMDVNATQPRDINECSFRIDDVMLQINQRLKTRYTQRAVRTSKEENP